MRVRFDGFYRCAGKAEISAPSRMEARGRAKGPRERRVGRQVDWRSLQRYELVRRDTVVWGTMTKREVETVSHRFKPGEQWRRWHTCGHHRWQALPTTTDTGDHYCPNCYVLLDEHGTMLTIPTFVPPIPPSDERSL